MSKTDQIRGGQPAEPPCNNRELINQGFDRVRDAARFLGLSVSQIYVYMDRGELPYAKFGKARRIPHNSLVDFASRHLVGGASAWLPGLPITTSGAPAMVRNPQ